MNRLVIQQNYCFISRPRYLKLGLQCDPGSVASDVCGRSSPGYFYITNNMHIFSIIDSNFEAIFHIVYSTLDILYIHCIIYIYIYVNVTIAERYGRYM